MAYSSGITWERTPEQLVEDMVTFGNGINTLALFEAENLAKDAEIFMKIQHPWENRTGNAERGLTARALRMGDSKIEITLAHGVDYGKYLELSNAGKFQIILPTQQVFGPELMRRLDGMFARVKP